LSYDSLRKLADANELAGILRDIVRIPSHVDEPHGEERVATYLMELLRKEGIASELQYPLPKRPNVIGRIGGDRTQSILLAGHIDINPPTGMTIPPFEGIIKNGRVYGRGALDMKGGVASMTYALLLVKRLGLSLNGAAVFAGVMGEAIGGSEGAKYIAKNGPKTSMGIIGEPTGLNIVTAHKGMEWFDVIFEGKAAFGAFPWAGISAIDKAVDYIAEIKQSLLPKFKQRRHALVGEPTLNIGTIEGYGGHRRPNVVPDYCNISIDRRLVPGEKGEQAFNELEEIAEQLRRRDKDFKAQVKRRPEMAGRAPMEVPSDHALVKSLIKSTKTVTGKATSVVGAPGFTDASYLVNDGGIPTVVFGPGSDHGPTSYTEESIEIEELMNASLCYALTILDICE
jgi:acetylornithine deacetylase/succinyl-diaminopimelate desuccinylase